jgi:hypothetical protein
LPLALWTSSLGTPERRGGDDKRSADARPVW